MRGSGLNGQLAPGPCWAYMRWCSHTSTCAESSAEALGELHWIGLCWIISSGWRSFSMMTCLP